MPGQIRQGRAGRAGRVAAAIATAAAAVCVLPGAARADTLFNESFTHPTVSSPTLSVGASGGGSPFRQVCLTAGTSTTQTPIPGCTAGQASLPAGGDGDGSGALRFTDNENNVAGFLLSNDPLPLTAGLDISFDYYAYNGSGADGLSFFLVNGSTTLTTPGANGGSLGYAQRNATPGVANGYLGVGLDEYGNFTNDTENRGSGCATRSTYSGLHSGYVGLRGPGNGTTGYCLLAAGPVSGGLASPHASSRTAVGVEKQVEIRIDPPANPNPQVTVLVNGTQVLQAAEPPNPPPTFKFGFAASTGGATDVHEIQNLAINTVNVLPKLTLTNTPNGTPTAGGSLGWTLQGQTDPSGGTEAQPVTITDTLPAGVTVSAPPSGSGWDCSATVVGSATVSCTYTPSSALAPGTALPPLDLPTVVGADARGPLTATATIASTDNANAPAQSTALGTVTPTTSVDTRVTVTPPAPVDIGQPATFTVSAANAGPSTATSTTVTVPIPAGATFDSGPAGCTADGSSVVCAVGTLAPGQSVSLPLVFTPGLSGDLEVQAAIGQTEPDANAADNTASAEATVIAPAAPAPDTPPITAPGARSADLGVTVTPPATAPAAGAPVPFTLTATNHGPDTDAGVAVTATIPSGASVVSLSSDCQVVDAATVICVAPRDLAKGESRDFELVLGPAGSGTLSVTATATGQLPDDSPVDNTATAAVTIPGTPPAGAVDLGVTLTSRTSGATTMLDVTVTNRGTTGATGASVVIPLPSGADPVSVPHACTMDGTTEICALGDIAGGHTRHLKLTLDLHGSGTQGGEATVRSDQPDSSPADNHAVVKVAAPRQTPATRPTRSHAKTTEPQLSLTSSLAHPSVISGGTVTLTLRVRTSNHTTAHRVRVCERLPRGLRLAGHPARRGRICVTVPTVDGHPRALHLRVRAATVRRSTVVHPTGTATAPRAGGASASSRLVIVAQPAPKFTG